MAVTVNSVADSQLGGYHADHCNPCSYGSYPSGILFRLLF